MYARACTHTLALEESPVNDGTLRSGDGGQGRRCAKPTTTRRRTVAWSVRSDESLLSSRTKERLKIMMCGVVRSGVVCSGTLVANGLWVTPGA